MIIPVKRNLKKLFKIVISYKTVKIHHLFSDTTKIYYKTFNNLKVFVLIKQA